MPKFGTRSRERLDTCHQDLQTLFEAVIEEVDCSVICGHRNKADQDKAFASGNSKAILKWDGDTPSVFDGMATFSHSEILTELAKSAWSEPDA